MNKLTFLSVIGSVAVVSTLFGQQPIIINPKIKEVTVYLSGAEIRYTESVPLKKGLNVVHFRGLSSFLVDNSVQVTLGDDTDIVSVSTSTEKWNAIQVKPELIKLKDSIERLENQVALVANQVDAFDMEKKTLLQNQHLGSQQGSVSLSDLAKAADFFRERTLKINNSLYDLNKNLKSLTDQLSAKKEKLGQEEKELSSSRYIVNVTVDSKSDHSEEFLIRHLVEDAEWVAAYDIVATEINKPIMLKYKAQVYNYTDIDWQNVKLVLSTGDISADASKPHLTAWTLNYASTGNEGFLNSRFVQRKDQGGADTIAVEREIAVSELNKLFTIDQRHSIRSDGEPYQISLQSETLPATFEYLTIPKVEASVFLLAKVTGWEKLNLIDGAAKIYYGNSFIGESDINTQLIGDTLELSLGRDKQIVVNRTKVEDKGNTQAIGGKRTESFVYEIEIRNNRKGSVSVKVLDQIPVAQEKDIIVEASDISGAAPDAQSGRLQWIKNLNSGETQKYRIAFTVKYPKNRNVVVRKNRVVRTPKYRQ